MITLHEYNGPLGNNINYWTNWTIDEPKTDKEEYRVMQVLNMFINALIPRSNN